MVQLDDSQRAFIEAPAGHIRLLAPAGCGKTLCLLYRCKHLAEQSPNRRQRFLIVTFTNGASQELQRRLNEDNGLFGVQDKSDIEIMTLNAWGNRRIREPNLKLLETNQDYHNAMWHLLRPVWNKSRYENVQSAVQKKSNYVPRKFLELIDSLKSMGFDHKRIRSKSEFFHHWNEILGHGLDRYLEKLVEQLIEYEVLEEVAVTKSVRDSSQAVFEAFYAFWLEATEHLKASATITYEDQKYWAYQDERKKIEEGIRLTGATRYHHVLIDEFQDINPLDLALVRAIIERNVATLTIAGDDDQAIFEWRGATPDYILDPSRFFGLHFHTYKLEVNYRSPSNIVECSQRLITKNKRREPKRLYAASSMRAEITCQPTANITEAMEFVYNLISSSVDQGEKPSQIALIGRLQSQIIPYQVYFAAKNVPFCAAKDLHILRSKTFDRLLHLLEIKSRGIGHQSSRQVVKDILFLCDYVKRFPLSTRKDRPTLTRWLQEARPVSMADGVNRLAEYRGQLKRSKNLDGRISKEMANAVRKFVDSEKVSDALFALKEYFAGLRKDFVKAEDDFFFKDPPYLHLAEYAKRYGTNYNAFVEDIELARETLAKIPPIDETGEDLSKYPLHLLTATRAKGKEFDRVVLLDAESGTWPVKHAETEREHEAERRLFYVAFTRAREQVTMLVSKSSVQSPYIRELGF